MKYTARSIATTAIVLLSTPFASAATECKKFTPTKDVFDILQHGPYPGPTWEDQYQQLTAYKECKVAPQPKGYYGCNIENHLGERIAGGCAFGGNGALKMQGTVNTSMALTKEQKLHLYFLVNANMTDAQQKQTLLVESANGCIPAAHPQDLVCIEQGRSGYVQGRPLKACVEGTLSGCSGTGGPFSNGMALEVCGGTTGEYAKSNPVPNAYYAWIHVDPKDKDRYKVDPALRGMGNKALCANFNAAASLAPSWVLAMGALAAGFFAIL